MDLSKLGIELNSNFPVPVTVIVFNRPEHTRRLLNSLAIVKPTHLFVIADGPRADVESDIQKCAQVRSLFEELSWECEVVKIYSDENLGCKHRVISGLNSVFQIVDFSIILEDDCIPNKSFFYFCSELGELYKDDASVGMISGNNKGFSQFEPSQSYGFSIYPHIWGWATWKRAWQQYDQNMKSWLDLDDQESWITSVTNHPKAAKYWKKSFDAVSKNQLDTWDYQWVYTLWVAEALTIIPEHNLVTNIGFGKDATHTTTPSLLAEQSVTTLIFPLKHPTHVSRDVDGDLLQSKKLITRNLQTKIIHKSIAYLRQLSQHNSSIS